MLRVGFEPTPFRTRTLIWRLRPTRPSQRLVNSFFGYYIYTFLLLYPLKATPCRYPRRRWFPWSHENGACNAHSIHQAMHSYAPPRLQGTAEHHKLEATCMLGPYLAIHKRFQSDAGVHRSQRRYGRHVAGGRQSQPWWLLVRRPRASISFPPCPC
jgi:hypothetical protein